MAEPTSSLTFENLIIEVARKIGVASYGAGGTGIAAKPTDAHDLDECKRHVNNGIRMFIADAPPSGWNWTKPVAEIALWPTVEELAGRTVSGGAFAGGITTVTASASVFHASMERKTLSISGVGDFVIKTFTSATVVDVEGDASSALNALFSIEANGNYTLPDNFGGQYSGTISYAPSTNRGVTLGWSSDGEIRLWRENADIHTGQPWIAAVRVMDNGTPRRRWELMVYPTPDELLMIQFPYDLHFDSLVNDTDVHPAPFTHDEAIRAACLAVTEKDVEGVEGPDWKYYRKTCLPNSYRIDARSKPRKLGYFGDPGHGSGGIHPIRVFRENLYQRPEVTYTP